MAKIRIDQLDVVSSQFTGAGTDSRQLSLADGGVTETKLGFSWKTVEIPASSFVYSSPRSTYSLATAASADANVVDMTELLRNGVGDMTRVTAPTANPGEYSLSGTTLSVHGDVTGTSDTYLLRYVVGSASGTGAAATWTDLYPTAVSGGNTVNNYGWATARALLIKVEAFSAVHATVGAYTMAVAKDPAGTPVNQLLAATYDLTGLTDFVPGSAPLAVADADRTFEIGDVWRAQFVSDNAGLDAEGVYFALTWLAL